MVLASDSVFVYVAESLGVPAVGMYGAFSSELRAKGLNVYALDAPGGCYSCCTHTALPCEHSKDSWSCCLKAIDPAIVVMTIKKALGIEDIATDKKESV